MRPVPWVDFCYITFILVCSAAKEMFEIIRYGFGADLMNMKVLDEPPMKNQRILTFHQDRSKRFVVILWEQH